MSAHDAVQVDRRATPSAAGVQTTATHDSPAATIRETEADLIAATLAWCARRFGAPSARFVRPLSPDSWQVITWMNEMVSSHPADVAEIAMAWIVALGRTSLHVGRPRVSALDGGAVRPISTRRYLGVPVICNDRLLGVIEVAGDLRPDVDSAAAAAHAEIDRFATRLAFDPSLRPSPPIGESTVVAIGGGAWIDDALTTTTDELRLAAALAEPRALAEVAAAIGLPLPRVLDIARAMERRGLLEVIG